jgi:hypothetical protein
MPEQTMMDQLKGWRTYARLHDEQTDPRRKAMVANMMDHYKWEVLGQPDRLLEGLHPDTHYRFYGLAGGTRELRGRSEVRAFYQSLKDSGANVLQLDIHHLLVDDEAVAGYGVWHQVYTGAAATGEGSLIKSDEIDDPDGRYLISQPQAWFMPYSDDEVPLLLGEIVFFNSEPLTVRKLADGEEVFGDLTEDMFTR